MAVASAGEALLVTARFDRAALRALARVGVLPRLLSGLVRVPAREHRGGSLARRLAGVPTSEWDALILELVRGQTAAVLGHDSPAAADPERAFKELGFDSLSAVELRNRLTQVTGVRLPATLVFDHPNCAAVARLLRSRVEGVARSTGVTARRSASVGEPIAIVGMSCRYPGGVALRKICGSWWRRAGMRFPGSPPTVAGIWRGCTTPIPIIRYELCA